MLLTLNERKYIIPVSAKNIIPFILSISSILFIQCAQSQQEEQIRPIKKNEKKKEIILGAHQFDEYKSFLKDKRVAVVGNHTSTVDSIHLVDFLLSKDAVSLINTPVFTID